MWCFLIIACFTIPWINAQGERSQRPFDNGHGWDIRLAVPGQPGNDYPLLNSIPRTTFTCSGKDPGYYADIETNCQVFRVCTVGSTYGFQSFLCPNGTLFNQEVFVCDWWMNVNCQQSAELFNNRNEKFTNLKLGPQFMTDIKKMITHPIRNPYNKTQVKSNILYMQVYKPPLGQLYNEALLRHLERNTNDMFVKKKQVLKAQSDLSTIDITFAASTSTSQYVPNNIFQNQIKNSPYSQFKGLTSNAHGGQTSQIRNQNQNTLYFNRNIETSRQPITSNTNSQLNTFNNNYINKNKQVTFGVEFSKQRLNQNFKKEQQTYTPRPTQARFSMDTVSQLDKETKQNLDLVFSYLADSINAAQQYNNIAQDNLLIPTPTQQQFENIRNEQLQQIAQDISGLTSSQFTRSNSGHYLSSNIVKTPKPELNSLSQIRENQSTINDFTVSQQQQQQYLTLQNNAPPSQNIIHDTNIYSGQLYQLPVPVVTRQIYNSPLPSISNYILSGNLLPTNPYINTKQTNERNSNEVEIIPSRTISITDIQTTTSQKNSPTEQKSPANYVTNHFRIPTNSIRAEIQDNIVGTLPHPLDNNKLIRYKKDQSYDIYTHINNNYLNSYDDSNDKTRNTIDFNQGIRQTENNKLSFQLVPSLGYKLEDEKAKQNILNVFHIDDFGSPKKNTFYISQKTADIKRRQDVSTDVDFTVDHPASSNNINNARNLPALYDGPSSYFAPQASVGNLEPKQNYQSDSRLNANLEKFDALDDTIGYPKITPSKKFLF